MRLNALVLGAALAASGSLASGWFPGSKTAYNKWHQTELERWLSDHDIPHPTPADRADLESLVEKNWNDYVVEPYNQWDTAQLNHYIQLKGKEAGNDAVETRDTLVDRVKTNWAHTEDNARLAYANVKEWIFESWSESQLKNFCDRNNIPVPQPRTRDSLLQKARSGYEAAAKKAGETAAYPGSWLYKSWAESDLKSWLDSRGFPAPQPTNRDKLIASVRRYSRLAFLKAQAESARANARARAAYSTLTDTILDAWGESQLKEFCDKNGIPVPQGTRANELRALVRKRRAEVLSEGVDAKAASAFGAATSMAGNEYAKASDSASLAAEDAFNRAAELWSESRLKAYLDARGVPVPQNSNMDSLRALVRKHTHKAAGGWGAWVLDDFSRENLQQYLKQHGNDAAKAAAEQKDASRDALVSAAHSVYSSASSAGGVAFASVTSAIASATAAAKHSTFEAWTDTDLKAYLDSYGIPVPQGSNLEQLKALARKHSTYFTYGTSTPGETILAKIGDTARQGWDWVAQQLNLGSQAAQQKAAEAASAAKVKVSETREEL
ncbi:Stress response protein ish1 [Ophiocordyceps camponoti-floridani]|uniref:Stress response protein ish1 n=1 Tax=Ophiocordyceps camponoti-floridani TaxID=2030778 RepID=A0A8H4QBH1_9HYPO|nr:Stress response protein ish1 [Ophiocordyceps camponoti-floridani]